MKNFIIIIQNELRHFVRSPFKTISLVFFVIAAIYGLQNGYDLYKKQHTEITAIKANNEESIQKVLADRYDNVDEYFKDPYMALWNTPSTVVKTPSVLMPFSIGQAEQFGYYKKVTFWSSIFDSDLAEEIANPERLTSGTLDFSFVVLCLLPVLLIILLFNVGGLEKDLGFDRLIQTNIASRKKWLLARFMFYFVLTAIILLSLMIVYAEATGALQSETYGVFKTCFFVILYSFIWFTVFYLISLSGKGSSNQALKMVTVWLLFCIVIPGAIHQIASLKYPVSYMTNFIDASREETYKLWDLPTDSVRNRLLVLYPELADTKHSKDTIANKGIIGDSSSGLVNELKKKTAETIENNNEEKNQFIQDSYWINPVSFFQNKLNALADNDYYAYKRYRNDIQIMIDKKINILLLEGWNKVTVDKEKYLEYVEQFKQ